MLKDFKAFIMRGSVVDLAVAVIIGAAFGKIVTSLVADVVMPPIGLLLGKVNFGNLYVNMSSTRYESLKAAQDAGAPTINYGLFLNSLVDFVIVGFVVFLMVRMVNRLHLKHDAQAAAIPTRECPYCVSAISAKATRCPHCTSELRES